MLDHGSVNNTLFVCIVIKWITTEKVDFLHVPAIKINRVEEVGLSLSDYTFIITIFCM